MHQDEQYRINIRNYLIERALSASSDAKGGNTGLAADTENFMRDFLNHLLGCNFRNINAEKRNARNFDLEDSRKKLIAQVSIIQDASKVRDKIEEGLKECTSRPGGPWHYYYVSFHVHAQEIKLDPKVFSRKAESGVIFHPKKDFLTIDRLLELAKSEAAEGVDGIDKLKDLSGLVDRYRSNKEETSTRYGEGHEGPSNNVLSGKSLATKRRKKKIKSVAKTIGLLGSIIAIVVVILLIMEIHDKSHPKYSSEISSSWMTLQAAGEYLTDKSEMKIYSVKQNNNKDDSTYYSSGAGLIVIYNNLENQERIINGMKVICTDIKKDLHPVLSGSFWASEEDADTIEYLVYNDGWGAAEIQSLKVINIIWTEKQDAPSVPISYTDTHDYAIKGTKVEPGKTEKASMILVDTIAENFDMVDLPDGYYSFTFELSVLCTDENNEEYKITTDCVFIKTGEKLQYIDAGGQGGGDPVPIVLVIDDLSKESFEKEYEIFVELPAKNGVKIPLFILPSQSCTMSIQIEFHTLDGETICAKPITDAYFSVCRSDFFIDASKYTESTVISYLEKNGISIDDIGDKSFPFAEAEVIVEEEDEKNAS